VKEANFSFFHQLSCACRSRALPGDRHKLNVKEANFSFFHQLSYACRSRALPGDRHKLRRFSCEKNFGSDNGIRIACGLCGRCLGRA